MNPIYDPVMIQLVNMESVPFFILGAMKKMNNNRKL